MSDRRFTLPQTTGPLKYRAQIIAPYTALRIAPKRFAALDTELVYGQGVQVYDVEKSWSLVRAKPLITGSRRKAYIGYVKTVHIGVADPARANAYISALSAPVFRKADIKSAIRTALPMNSRIRILSQTDRFAKLEHGFVHLRHIKRAKDYAEDFVAIAEQFKGRPYIWGGTGGLGVDCSGLVQMSLCAAGIDSPRDADQQELYLGDDIDGTKYQRGDLIFWPGHVGIMLNGSQLLHANAFHMCTQAEPLSAAIKRIGPPRRAKRLTL